MRLVTQLDQKASFRAYWVTYGNSFFKVLRYFLLLSSLGSISYLRRSLSRVSLALPIFSFYNFCGQNCENIYSTFSALAYVHNVPYWFKGIDRSFELRGESRLIWYVMTNWKLGNFFLLHFKGKPSQDQQKTFRCRLITFKVTVTGQSHFKLIFWLLKVTLHGHINSVKCDPSHAGKCVPPPPKPKEGGHTLLRLRGRGVPIWTTGKSLSVYTVLCTKVHKIRQTNPTV